MDDDEFPDFDLPTGSYAVVHSLPDRPVVAATIFDEADSPIAHRQWILQPDGIHVVGSCTPDGRPLKVRANPDGTTEIAEAFCEDCAEVIAPEPVESIHEQLVAEVEAFADDWGTRPIRYYFREGAKEAATRGLRLTGLWLDEDALDLAAATWYIAEGERLLDDIEQASGDLEKIRSKFPLTPSLWDDVRSVRK